MTSARNLSKLVVDSNGDVDASSLGNVAAGLGYTALNAANNLSDVVSASTARTNLGLGTIATQASSSVSITGGSITGITDLAVADGGTGASTATDARTNLGLGSLATVTPTGTADSTTYLRGDNSWAAIAGFPAGTVMLFAQTSAPTGWTKDTTNYNNSALRVVTGSASTGGSVDFSTAFASQAVSGTVGSTTLTTSQIPSHTHTVPKWTSSAGTGANFDFGSGGTQTSSSTGGGGSHDHSFSGTAINLAVKYVDVIRATKD